MPCGPTNASLSMIAGELFSIQSIRETGSNLIVFRQHFQNLYKHRRVYRTSPIPQQRIYQSSHLPTSPFFALPLSLACRWLIQSSSLRPLTIRHINTTETCVPSTSLCSPPCSVTLP